MAPLSVPSGQPDERADDADCAFVEFDAEIEAMRTGDQAAEAIRVMAGNVDNNAKKCWDNGENGGPPAATQPERAAKDPRDQTLVEQLLKSVATGDVESRGGLGNRFLEYLKVNKMDGDVYKSFTGKPECVKNKKMFRLRWANTVLENKTEIKENSRSMETLFRNNVVFMPLDRIIKLEGGRHSPAAVRAASMYIKNAQMLGNHFFRWPGNHQLALHNLLV